MVDRLLDSPTIDDLVAGAGHVGQEASEPDVDRSSLRIELHAAIETSRLVAVVMADLVGSTGQRATHGDRLVDVLMARYESETRAAVESTRGVLVKFLGDGLLAMFPTSSDAIEGAVRLQRAITRLDRHTPVDVRQRVGVTVGEVALCDGDGRGIVIAEASRLCSAAAAGQILVSETARRTARQVMPSFASMGELTLRGLPEPVLAWSVSWNRPLPQDAVPVRLRPAGERMMVGRDAEVATVHRVWALAATEVQTLLVTGEAGIGKSRLVHDLADHALRSGGIVLAGHCEEFADAAYQPLAELVGQLLELDAADQRWTTFFAERADQLAAIVPASQRRPGTVRASAADAEERTERLVLGVVEWLEQLSDDAPVLVVLEDVHWAQPELLHLVRRGLAQTTGMRVCFVLTSRDADVVESTAAEIAALRRGPKPVHSVALTGLAADAAEQLLAAPGDRVTTEVAGRLQASTGGNPLFLLALADELPVSPDGEGPVDWLEVPGGVREVLERQVGRLAEPTCEVLRVAAVLGARFEVDLAMKLSGRSVAECDRAIEEAERAGIVRECSTPAVLSFEFRHALIAGVLRDQLTTIRRRRTHAVAAELLRTDRPVLGERISRAARHAVEAGPALAPAIAFDLLDQATSVARAAGSLGDAQRWAVYALDLATECGNDRAVVEWSVDLARIRFLLGRKAVESAVDAIAAARRFGDPHLLAEAALVDDPGTYTEFLGVDDRIVANLREALASLADEDSSHRARLLAALAAQRTFVDPAGDRFTMSDEALAMARRVGDLDTLAHVLQHRLSLFSGLGHAAARMVEGRELLAIRAGLGDAAADISLLQSISHAHLQLGDAEAGRDAMATIHAVLSGRTITAARRGSLLMWDAGWAMLDGDLIAAERAAKEAFKIGASSGGGQATMATARQLLGIRSWQDRTEAMIGSVRQGAALVPMLAPHLAYWLLEVGLSDDAQQAWADWDDETSVPAMLIGGAGESIVVEAAMVCAALDSATRCRFYFDLLGPYAEVMTNPICPERSTHLVLGRLAARMGDHDTADAHFTAAVEHSRRLRAPLLEADAGLVRVRHRLDQADIPAEAEHVARHAIATGERLGAARLVRLGAELLVDIRAARS